MNVTKLNRMKNGRKQPVGNAEKIKTPAVFSRIKNSERVQDKQLLIAKKAAKLFVRKGYAQTTVREISKATGLAMGNLYDYINKKEDILCLVFDTYHETVEESSYGPEIATIEDPLEQMQTNVRVALKNIRDFHDEIMLMYRESHLLPKKYLERAKKQELMQIRKTADYIRRGVKKGVFQVKDPFFASSMLFCLLASPALRGWTFAGRYSRKKTDSLLEDFILRALGVR
ncbi:MAG: TetR/AcrR family transcriptional regulator [Smithellaceae bacterium]|nr:TetR/AcrR family transcriptional regulator [Syntrophaceae bacterium]MDD4239935.1 TetR/AcrR family transcriptional regulator [Smithellaceae bacterium]NLX51598.1 TetR/AcrR family transcriptional regulator [Deltaproteobacteria bacterium]